MYGLAGHILVLFRTEKLYSHYYMNNCYYMIRYIIRQARYIKKLRTLKEPITVPARRIEELHTWELKKNIFYNRNIYVHMVLKLFLWESFKNAKMLILLTLNSMKSSISSDGRHSSWKKNSSSNHGATVPRWTRVCWVSFLMLTRQTGEISLPINWRASTIFTRIWKLSIHDSYTKIAE